MLLSSNIQEEPIDFINDILIDYVFKSFLSVIYALDVPLFMIPNTNVDITFWELLLGFLIVGIIFGFFLAPRAGSGIQTMSNEHKKANAEYIRQQKLKAGGGKKK